jgi:hypothetical protein
VNNDPLGNQGVTVILHVANTTLPFQVRTNIGNRHHQLIIVHRSGKGLGFVHFSYFFNEGVQGESSMQAKLQIQFQLKQQNHDF